jgi:hypothetical protein
MKILRNRSVLGELHPTKRVEGKPVALDPIIGYYPPIISQAIFDQAHQAIASRRGKGTGRPAQKTYLLGYRSVGIVMEHLFG